MIFKKFFSQNIFLFEAFSLTIWKMVIVSNSKYSYLMNISKYMVMDEKVFDSIKVYLYLFTSLYGS